MWDSQDQETPLHAAALHGKVDALKALLDKGANKEARNQVQV